MARPLADKDGFRAEGEKRGRCSSHQPGVCVHFRAWDVLHQIRLQQYALAAKVQIEQTEPFHQHPVQRAGVGILAENRNPRLGSAAVPHRTFCEHSPYRQRTGAGKEAATKHPATHGGAHIATSKGLIAESRPGARLCNQSLRGSNVSSPRSRRMFGGSLLAGTGALAVRRMLAEGSVRDRRRPRSRVAILRENSYAGPLDRVLMEGLRLFDLDLGGKSVLLKPNLVEYIPGAEVNTNPRLVGAAATAFLALGAKTVLVGEGPGH